MKYTKEIVTLMLQDKEPVISITEFIEEKVEENRKHQMMFWLVILLLVICGFAALSVNQHIAAERYKAEHPMSVSYEGDTNVESSSSVRIVNGDGNSINVEQ